LDEEEEKIILYGPLYQGKWTCAQAGQAEFLGICQAGIDRFNALRLEAGAGRTPQGLAVENLFLTKHWDDKGIRAPTFNEEVARRRRRGGGAGRQVAAAPVMNAEAVQQRFDEKMLGTCLTFLHVFLTFSPFPCRPFALEN